jgi:hypothetical protein
MASYEKLGNLAPEGCVQTCTYWSEIDVVVGDSDEFVGLVDALAVACWVVERSLGEACGGENVIDGGLGEASLWLNLSLSISLSLTGHLSGSKKINFLA